MTAAQEGKVRLERVLWRLIEKRHEALETRNDEDWQSWWQASELVAGVLKKTGG